MSSGSVLLGRLLALKEQSPLLLALDTVLQSSHYLTQELAKRSRGKIIYISFETTERPEYATEFIEALGKTAEQIVAQVPAERSLVIVDSFNYVKDLRKFLRTLVSPDSVLYGTYHLDVPAPRQPSRPSALSILRFVATAVFELRPKLLLPDMEEKAAELVIPKGCNRPEYKMTLIYRRKSGRTLEYQIAIDDGQLNDIKEVEEKKTDEQDVLEGLTTFNLTTTNKQKQERDQVELPFLEAQKLGKMGGSIVYEDDDYDEEDPYEDPI